MRPADNSMRPLIAIPAFNEEKNILRLLSKLLPWKKDVIVIDDGSIDNTAALVERSGFMVLTSGVNSGLARFYITAKEYALANSYTHLIALDADGQHDPAYIPGFIGAFETTDLVSGDRFHDVAAIPDSKIASNLFAVLLFKVFLNIDLPDAACGFRGARLSALSVEDYETGFGIVYDMLVRHAMSGRPLHFVKIPAIYDPEKAMNTNISEIRGLLSTVQRYNPSADLKQVMESVDSRSPFRISLAGIGFSAIFQAPGAYLFETDPDQARDYFQLIHSQTSSKMNQE